jgi:maltose O-acetyltransferase
MGFIATLRRLVLVKPAIWAREFTFRSRIDDLMARGLTVGKNVEIRASARIDPDFPYLISIGDNCVINGGAWLLAHDPSIANFTGGCLRLGRIEIKDDCFIGENSVILPGVTIGPNVLVAACSVVSNDVPPNSCVAGAPARSYSKFDEMLESHEKRLRESSVFMWGDVHFLRNEQLKMKVKQAVAEGETYAQGYVTERPYLVNGEGDGK